MSDSTPTLTIGALAKQTGTAAGTIRFYEQQGLLPPAHRTPSGYRKFGDEAVSRLRFIERAKRLGFSLADIQSLMALEETPEASAADVRRRVVDKIAEIDERLAELSSMRDSLSQLAARCDGKSDIEHCPIMESLNRAEDG